MVHTVNSAGMTMAMHLVASILLQAFPAAHLFMQNVRS